MNLEKVLKIIKKNFHGETDYLYKTRKLVCEIKDTEEQKIIEEWLNDER